MQISVLLEELVYTKYNCYVNGAAAGPHVERNSAAIQKVRKAVGEEAYIYGLSYSGELRRMCIDKSDITREFSKNLRRGIVIRFVLPHTAVLSKCLGTDPACRGLHILVKNFSPLVHNRVYYPDQNVSAYGLKQKARRYKAEMGCPLGS
jgi:hypothetical protein